MYQRPESCRKKNYPSGKDYSESKFKFMMLEILYIVIKICFFKDDAVW